MDIHRAYRVLGLSPDATPAEVQEAYRDLAQVWHPDRFAHNERLREKAARNLQRINEAFEIARKRNPDAPMPRRSMLNMTMDAVRDLGDIMQTAVSAPPTVRPRTGPAVLGLGTVERTGHHRMPRHRRRKGRAILTTVALIVVGAGLALTAWLW